VSTAGGTPIDVTTPDPATGDRWPHFLPDGRHFFYTAVMGGCCPAPQPGVIRLGSVDSNEAPVTLLQAESFGLYSSGHLFFARDDTLMAQPFNADARTLHGEAVRIADHVSWEGSRYVSASVSDAGTLVYGQGSVPTILQMTWFDRSGSILSRLGDPGQYATLSLSPDQQSVAVSFPIGNPDVWLFSVATGSRSQLTRNPGPDRAPVWSPDGKSIAVEAERDGKVSLRQLSIDGNVDEALIEDGSNRPSARGLIGDLTPTSWSNDGRFIAFTRRGPSGSPDIWALPLFGDRKAFAVVDTPYAETSGVFSPDGRWIAYTTDESGAPRVTVQPFPVLDDDIPCQAIPGITRSGGLTGKSCSTFPRTPLVRAC
jgi:dipeptidyl aminopeptidase/acylaminoacyl peptidase